MGARNVNDHDNSTWLHHGLQQHADARRDDNARRIHDAVGHADARRNDNARLLGANDLRVGTDKREVR